MKKEVMLNETVDAKKKRCAKITEILAELYPGATTSLNHGSPFELLIATILSAQCTDKRVNIVTESLFTKYKTPEDYVNAGTEELEQDIRSTGFYKMKTKHVKNCCKGLIELYDGTVPDTMDQLLKLQGVARKTANVILGIAFGKAEGIVIDTHVDRISKRLGLSSQKNRDKLEQDLMNVMPREEWINYGSRIILHGRETCKAKKPLCSECRLSGLCPARME